MFELFNHDLLAQSLDLLGRNDARPQLARKRQALAVGDAGPDARLPGGAVHLENRSSCFVAVYRGGGELPPGGVSARQQLER